MDSERIIQILEEIGAQNIREYRKNIQCSCFLSDWREGHSSGSDHAGSMGISIDENGPSRVNCFSCHFGGSLVHALGMLGRYSGEDYAKLIRQVGKAEALDLEFVAKSIQPYDEAKKEAEDPGVAIGECVFRMAGLKPGTHKTIVNRGISISTLKEWDARYDHYYRRVVFPVRSRVVLPTGCGGSTLVGASGRTIYGDVQPTYFNYFRFDKSRYLFGEQFSLDAQCGVVVEGILDTVAVRQAIKEAGFERQYCALGLMGSSAAEGQVKKLVKWFNEVVLFLDNDPAGWTGSRKLAQRIQRSVLLRAVRYPKVGGSDPSELVEKNAGIVRMIIEAPLVVTRTRR